MIVACHNESRRQVRHFPGCGIVPQIVDARRTVVAATDPVQFPTQLIEDTVDLPIAERPTETAAAGGDEERPFRIGRHVLRALKAVGTQGGDGTGMQRHQARLAELAAADSQDAEIEVDIGVDQGKGFGNAQARTGYQSEQGPHDRTAQRRPDPSGRFEQRFDLLVAEYVRCDPAGDRSEGRLVGDLGRWLELLQPARKRPKQTQSASRRTPITLPPLDLQRPSSHHVNGKWSAVTGFLDIAREPAECLPHVMKLETETTPLDQVLIDPREKG
jgi:hypothetical protein